MARFNQRGTRPAVHSPVTTTGERTVTHEGATGHLRDARSELFLLAVSNFVGQDVFYEKGGDRDDRYTQLVRQLAIEDPEWTAGLLGWLRGEGNMRTAALVGAAEFTAERLLHEAPGYSRQVIDSVLQRADEPGEMLGYWTSKYGRKLPKPVKRGIADAVQRLYNERSLLKYDTDSKGYRFGDVLNLVHAAPDPDKPWQGDLFAYSLDRRHKRGTVPDPDTLPTLARNMAFPEFVDHAPAILLDADEVKRAGLTWEMALSMAGGKVDKAKLWEALIPSMGVMALARNLRNFDEAGVSDEVAARICARFADADQVAKSRMFPFRWWAAYKHAPSLRWAHALEQALGHSLANVPRLKGRTLILVDRSPSMFPGYGFSTPNSSDITLAEQAAAFGSALALRAADPTLVEFGWTSQKLDVPKGGSVLKLIERFGQIDGTDIPSAVKQHYDLLRHNRIVIVTDEQTRPGWLPSNGWQRGGMRETQIDDLIPKTVPVYMWNMAGYKPGAMPSGTAGRHTFGGLTDHAFRMVPLLESGRDADWPWVSKQA
ncbi:MULTISPECIES: TROVE domain-containing protein [Streptomyces]|uniref:TROVE domain-containing protein n=1 Tax=Streptomyces dengpaensis TaxID=2049881 RepID=A0ABM6SZ70_9ACTN|nr:MULTISPECIES: TROVE domain-containing protein [Streptomyces]AVH60029.1 TROVE domain-containing protein [Streptomyces dengpaensis]PIB09668.1 RNA-binding protein [Streptomyces sp. HG99]